LFLTALLPSETIDSEVLKMVVRPALPKVSDRATSFPRSFFFFGTQRARRTMNQEKM
jgi:hypothetical protein